MLRRKTDLLERLSVPKPCPADWDSMSGNDRVRFCEHCRLSVNDLSRLTRKEATRLVANSGGRLCVRYVQLPGGGVLTADAAPTHLYHIARRASRLAAGAAAAAISLGASVAAQTQTPSGRQAAGGAEINVAAPAAARAPAEAIGATLAGTVMDPAQARVAGTSVTLSNAQTGETRAASSNDEGDYSFSNVPPGTYTLRFTTAGFLDYEATDVSVQGGGQSRVDATLQIGHFTETTGGIMVIAEPSEPLVKAAFNDDLAEVEKLLSRGADANVLDRGIDSTALEHAVSHANLKMVKALLDAGADVNAEDRAGRTALMSLDEDATPDLVRALLDAGAEVKLRDDDGNSALAHAAARSTAEVVRRLLDAGAKINTRNDEGQTALMFAAAVGALENIRALVAAGADYNLKDDEGRTALHLARGGGHEEVTTLLVAHGAVEGDKQKAEEVAEEEEEEP